MKISLYLSVLLLAAACNTRDTNATGGTNTETQYITRTDTLYMERNQSISPANSYSDLFLDSVSVGQFMSKENISGGDEQALKSFYNYRNNQYAWFTSQGFTEQARGFWNLQDKLGTKASKSLRDQMDTLLNNDSLRVSRYDTAVLQTELALTKAYLDFYAANRQDTHFAGIPAENAIPVMKMNTMALADSLLRQPGDSMSNTSNPQDQYGRLKQQLRMYVNMARSGNGQPLPANVKKLKKGSNSADVKALKIRLQQTGVLAPNDTSSVYNDSLANAIKMFQQQNGMKATGTITDSLVRFMNVPSEERIQKIIVNLYRAQWMPVRQEANYIAVNIPEFMLKVYENNAPIFEIPVAVGKEGTSTTMFNGNLNQVVFSPYWNIPVSIVKYELLPKMKANPKYLDSRNMEIVGNKDAEVPRIRQKPGKGNALGRVKFLFPNRYDIYFHDTYNEEVFKKENRAVSHGCIRLQDPEKLANYLLKDDKSWTPEKIHTAMQGDKEQYVKVSPPVPVWITYYTAWVNDNGQMEYRPDLYGHDSETAQMLFDNRNLSATNYSVDSLNKKTTDTSKKVLKKP